MPKSLKIYSGSSHPKLAGQIAKGLKVDLGKIELSRFDNRESKVYVQDQVPDIAVVVQSLSIPVDRHLFELLLIADALSRMGTKQIIAVAPWLGYSKQDKVFRSGEPLSAQVIARVIETQPFSGLISLDLHSPAIAGYFKIPVINVRARSLIIKFLKNRLNLDNTILISPDAGSIINTNQAGLDLKLPVAHISKKRDRQSGAVSVIAIDQPVAGFHTLILDDMISTGSTVIKTASFLKAQGAKSVIVAVTHHLHINSVQTKIDNSKIDHLFITDSVSPPLNLKSKKLVTIPCASLLTDSLKAMLK